MTRPVTVLLDELDVLRFQKAEADEALANINRSLEQDEAILQAHHAARCEISAARAVIEARLVDLEFEIERQMPEGINQDA